MKNNKGFTLIELLASMVILGILFTLGLPTIVSLVSGSRDKMYVSDAKAMIAVAEYKMRSRSVVIEKPSEGDCIVFSLNYLASSDFDDPPNRGEYLKFSSFVVVRNVGGNMVYSANLVEKYQGNNYKGIVLSSLDDLNKKKAADLVKPMKKNSLVSVSGTDGYAKVNEQFINDALNLKSSEKVALIENAYNFPDSGGYDITSDDQSTPVVKKATLSSTTLKHYNSLDATLNVEVSDEDTPLSKIKVYYKYTDVPNDSYPDPTKDTGYSYCSSADCKIFSVNLDLSKIKNPKTKKNYTYGDNVYINLLVSDDDGNVAKKRIQYPIHKNAAPEIDGTVTSKGDEFNLYSAILHVDIKDDMDELDSLTGCINVNSTSKTCTTYVKYSQLFDAEGNAEINFCKSGASCKYDEKESDRKRKVTVVLKDSVGTISYGTYEYELYSNKSPSVEVSINSYKDEFLTSDKNSLVASITISLTEDLSSPEKVSYEYYDFNYKDSTIKTGKFPSDGVLTIPKFVFGGNYDGKDRTFFIKVTDEYGKTNVTTNQKFTYGDIYTDSVPVILNASIKGNSALCAHCTIGYDNPGALQVKYSFNAKDDITKVDSLRYCISENKDYCKKDENYISYTEFVNLDNEYSFTPTDDDKPYDGSSRTLYFAAIDREIVKGVTPNIASATYTLYKNKAPEIKDLKVVSVNGKFNDYNTKLSFDIVDDITQEKDAYVDISVDYKSTSKNFKKENGTYSKLFSKSDEYDLVVGDKYEGDVMVVTVTVTDEYGEKATKSVEYTIFNNSAPVINDFYVSTNGLPCARTTDSDYEEKSRLCLGNSYDYIAGIDAYAYSPDGAMDNSTLKICVSDDQDYCNNTAHFVPYVEEYYGMLVPLDKNKDESNTDDEDTIVKYKDYEKSNDVRTMYLTVMDELGFTSTATSDYTLYTNKAPVIEDEVSVSTRSGTDDYLDNSVVYNNPDYHTIDIDFTVKAIDEFDDSSMLTEKVCYRNGYNIEEFCNGDYVSYEETTTVYLKSGPFLDYTIYAYIMDSYGEVTVSDAVQYSVSPNEGPTISSFTVERSQQVCDKTFTKGDETVDICASGGSNSYIATIDAFDDVDNASNLKVCISDVETDCVYSEENTKYVDYSESYELEVTNPSEIYMQENDTITIYAYVADSAGNVTSKSVEYTLYKNQAPFVVVDPVVTSDIEEYTSFEEMASEFENINSKNAIYNVSVMDDFDDDASLLQKVCYYEDRSTVEHCFTDDYEDFSSQVNIEFPATSYSGQKYYVYSYVKDSSDNVNKTSMISYELFTDENPELKIYAVQPDPDLDYNSNNVTFGFIVKDIFDDYKICIKDDNSACEDSEYTEYYSGTNYCPHNKTFTFEGWDYTDKDAYNEKRLYISIKDKNGKVISNSVPYKIYKACDSVIDNENRVSHTDDSNIDSLYSTYTDFCGSFLDEGEEMEELVLELYSSGEVEDPEEEDSFYEFIVDENGDEPEQEDEDLPDEFYTKFPVGSINTVSCAGKCYHTDENPFSARYRKMLNLYDKYFPNVFCEVNSTEEEVDLYCDYKDCFYNFNKSSYEYNVISNDLVEEDWTFVDDDGESYELTEYYVLYVSSYNEDEKKIELFPTEEKIPTNYEDYDRYKYIKTSPDTYIVAMLGE